MSEPRRGELWWGESPEAKGRPYLVLSRDEVIPVVRAIVVAPVSRTIRAIPSEVAIGPEDGLMVESAASMDNLLTFPKALLTRRLGALRPERRQEICNALATALDC